MIIKLIEKHVGKKPRNQHKTYDQILWALAFTYGHDKMLPRNQIKEATNSMPFALTYGHDTMLPIESYIQSTRIQRHN